VNGPTKKKKKDVAGFPLCILAKGGGGVGKKKRRGRGGIPPLPISPCRERNNIKKNIFHQRRVRSSGGGKSTDRRKRKWRSSHGPRRNGAGGKKNDLATSKHHLSHVFREKKKNVCVRKGKEGGSAPYLDLPAANMGTGRKKKNNNEEEEIYLFSLIFFVGGGFCLKGKKCGKKGNARNAYSREYEGKKGKRGKKKKKGRSRLMLRERGGRVVRPTDQRAACFARKKKISRERRREIIGI